MIKAFFTGDIVNSKGTDFLDFEFSKLIQKYDLSVCNLEGPVINGRFKKEIKVGPTISQNSELIGQLKKYGFNLMGLANNHIYDYGDEGIINTISKIKQLGLNFVGAGNFDEAYEPYVFKKNNISLGIISASENGFGCIDYNNFDNFGYAWINHKKIVESIDRLKKNVDFIVLLAHSGAENIPLPLLEWRERYKFLCDLGVDLIISHHPHVPQGYEQYGKSIIFYSLGNFYFDTCGFERKRDDSYSVNINFSKSGMSKEIIFHKKVCGILTQTSPLDVNFSINDLNSYLEPKNYNELHDEYCLKLYKEFYKFYYQHSMISIEMGFLKFLKKFIKFILRIESLSYRQLLLYHLITIESHKYVVRSALKKLFSGN